jgi:hypothetical protein
MGKWKSFRQIIPDWRVTKLAGGYTRVKKVEVGKGSESLMNNIKTYLQEEAEILLSFSSYFYYYYIYL